MKYETDGRPQPSKETFKDKGGCWRNSVTRIAQQKEACIIKRIRNGSQKRKKKKGQREKL